MRGGPPAGANKLRSSAGRFIMVPTFRLCHPTLIDTFMVDAAHRNSPTPNSPTPDEAPAPSQEREAWPGLQAPPLVALGRVVATPAAIVALLEGGGEPGELLQRHRRGDWGDLCEEDRAVNRKAVVLGYRLLSAYTLPASGEKIWIITEADRSMTTLLLPSEY